VAAGSRALEHLGEALTRRPADHRPGPSAVVSLPLELIVEPPGERRIRDVRADADLDTLAESLRAHGLLHPVGVRPLSDGRFELVYGGRRVAAARRLDWTTIQASLHLDFEDEPALVASLAENLHRKGLAPRERVAALRLLAQVHRPGTQLGGFSTGGHAAIRPPPRQPGSSDLPGSSGDLARKLGVDVSTVSRLAALGRDEQLLGMVEAGVLGLTAASHVARLPGPMRRQMLEDVEHEHLSATAVHLRVNQVLRARRRPTGPHAELDAIAPSPPSAPTGGILHRLRGALGVLANITCVNSEQERRVLEQIADQVERLRTTMAYA
jgi:ParB family chromosome partitioning protein